MVRFVHLHLHVGLRSAGKSEAQFPSGLRRSLGEGVRWTLPGHWTKVSRNAPDIDTLCLFLCQDNATNGLITERVTNESSYIREINKIRITEGTLPCTPQTSLDARFTLISNGKRSDLLCLRRSVIDSGVKKPREAFSN